MMESPEIRILQPHDQSALEAFLWPRIESSMFLIGNLRAAGLRDTGQPYTGAYAAVLEGGAIVAVVAHYWNGNLLLQAPVSIEELLRAAVAASGRPVKGLLGPDDQVNAAKAALGIDAAQIQLDDAERLYTLALDALVEPEALRSGRLRGRRIEPRDLDLLADWRIDYSLESLGEQPGPELRRRCRASVERALHEGRMWVLEDGGVAVACSGFNAVIDEAVQVGGVWTPPELRGRSYARAAVAASLRDARSAGHQRAILFTGEENIPAQKAYRALGFEHIGAYRVVLLREPHP